MNEKIDAVVTRLVADHDLIPDWSHQHSTWAKTFHSRPEIYFQPISIAAIQDIVKAARSHQRRIVVVGSGHSPSDLTLTSSWMINLDLFNSVIGTNGTQFKVQSGIRLRDLNARANQHGYTMPNLGSINDQSLAGAIATATHGSSVRHGLLSESVRSITLVLGNGEIAYCDKATNRPLFQAALVSLGALGVIVEIEFEMTKACNIEWTQSIVPLQQILATWDRDLWTKDEFTRVWWLPYTQRAIAWSASKTDKPLREPAASWYAGPLGFHTYHTLLWLSNKMPRILPWVEWFVFGMQYGFSDGATNNAVQPLSRGLLMDCLYSQFVNEWAIPLEKGPEALTRLSRWLNREAGHDIPFDNRGLYVHAPIEVRVTDTSSADPRPFMDNSVRTGPTLYLNATLYRAYLQDPPCRLRYYEAFEWLMRELGGRPHWAKNFVESKENRVDAQDNDAAEYMRVREEVDPDGVFFGAWHRRTLPSRPSNVRACEEIEVMRCAAHDGGTDWIGQQGSIAT